MKFLKFLMKNNLTYIYLWSIIINFSLRIQIIYMCVCVYIYIYKIFQNSFYETLLPLLVKLSSTYFVIK